MPEDNENSLGGDMDDFEFSRLSEQAKANHRVDEEIARVVRSILDANNAMSEEEIDNLVEKVRQEVNPGLVGGARE